MAFYGNTVSGVPLHMDAFLNQGGVVCDAGQVLAASTALKSVEAQIFENPAPPLKSGLIVARKMDAGAWARTTAFRTMDGSARMKPVGGAAADLPRVAFGLDEKVSPVRDFGVAFSYTRKDLIIAAKEGIPLDTTEAMLCGKAYELQVDDCASVGYKELGIIGVLSEGNGIPRNNSSVVIAAGTSPEDILKFLADLETAVIDQSNETMAPNTIALPLKVHQYISHTLMNSSGGSKTIKTTFLENSGYIDQIIPWDRCKQAGSPVKGTTNKHLALCCRRLDPTILRQQIPEALTTLPPQMVGLDTVVNCVASIGSVEIIQPKAVAIFEFPSS